MEIWKDIESFENYYQVSNKGRVKSVERVIYQVDNGTLCKRIIKEKILKPCFKKNGTYPRVKLSKNDKTERFFVHNLVAKAFFDDYNDNFVVHHIDRDTTNNNVENLQLLPKCEHNELHNSDKSKQVYQYTMDGELVKIWSSTREAGRNGYNQRHISDCCNGGFYYKSRGKWINVTQHKGFRWSYEPL